MTKTNTIISGTKRQKKTVIGLLNKALRRIAKTDNWTKGKYRITTEDGVDKYCAMGAINSTALSIYSHNQAIAALTVMLPPYYRSRGVVVFNDAKKTTHRDVVKLFKRAIKALEKEVGKES